MELPARQPVHARHGHGACRRDDRAAAQAAAARCRGYAAGLLAGLILWALAAGAAGADRIRLASFNTELSRDGPGLLLRDILRGEDADIATALNLIAGAGADIVLLQGIDWDAGGHALAALADALADAGAPYPHRFAPRPNSGRPTGLDLDGNGRLGEARDAQGYGRFNGDGGLALLSRWPVDAAAARDFSAFLWRDLPDATAAQVLEDDALAIQRLASVAAWDVPVIVPGAGRFHVLALHATPPVFDGPEDRNGLRNADEIRFWQHYLDGWTPDGHARFAARDFALMGILNVDPDRGEGRRAALRAFLDHPTLQDPQPRSAQAAAMGRATDTVDWPEPAPGNLRVGYVLPAAGLTVADSGVSWAEGARHGVVWVEIDMPPR